VHAAHSALTGVVRTWIIVVAIHRCPRCATAAGTDIVLGAHIAVVARRGVVREQTTQRHITDTVGTDVTVVADCIVPLELTSEQIVTTIYGAREVVIADDGRAVCADSFDAKALDTGASIVAAPGHECVDTPSVRLIAAVRRTIIVIAAIHGSAAAHSTAADIVLGAEKSVITRSGIENVFAAALTAGVIRTRVAVVARRYSLTNPAGANIIGGTGVCVIAENTVVVHILTHAVQTAVQRADVPVIAINLPAAAHPGAADVPHRAGIPVVTRRDIVLKDTITGDRITIVIRTHISVVTRYRSVHAS
jgi:hypothetical protein